MTQTDLLRALGEYWTVPMMGTAVGSTMRSTVRSTGEVHHAIHEEGEVERATIHPSFRPNCQSFHSNCPSFRQNLLSFRQNLLSFPLSQSSHSSCPSFRCSRIRHTTHHLQGEVHVAHDGDGHVGHDGDGHGARDDRVGHDHEDDTHGDGPTPWTTSA